MPSIGQIAINVPVSKDPKKPYNIRFESNFESGNLATAIYDTRLVDTVYEGMDMPHHAFSCRVAPDSINSPLVKGWFYFKVSGVKNN